MSHGKGQIYQSVVERIGEHISFLPNGCWEWTGSKNQSGCRTCRRASVTKFRADRRASLGSQGRSN